MNPNRFVPYLVLMAVLASAAFGADPFDGDGTLKRIPKAGLFGSKGVVLEFNRFRLMSGYDEQLAFKNLPVLKHNTYSLFFKPDIKIDAQSKALISIKMTLKDSGGHVLVSKDTTLQDWIMAESGDPDSFHYYYYKMDGNTVDSFRFTPIVDMAYTLELEFKAREQATIDGSGYFFLQAGGFK